MIARPPPQTSRQLNQQFVAELRKAMPIASSVASLHLAGQRVVAAHSEPTALPLVESGALQAVIWLSDGEHRVVPVSYGPGELALSSQLFAASPTSVDLLCATDSMLRWLPLRELEATLDRHPALLASLSRFLTQRLREVQARERIWLERGARERVWAGLLQAASQIGVACGEGVRLTLTHEQLAERCDISRPKLSRELKQLENTGLLRLGRGWIDVLDVAAPLPPSAGSPPRAWGYS